MDYTVGDIVIAVKGELMMGDAAARVAGVTTDSRDVRAGNLFMALAGDRFDGHDFVETAVRSGARAVVVKGERLTGLSCPSDAAVIAVDDPLTAYGDLARDYLRRLPGRRVAVTGSVGKTSTRRLLASALGQEKRVLESEKNFNNWIGVPKTAFRAKPEDDVLLFEFGADRPGEIKRLAEIVRPEIGVLTHVGPSHLERFESVRGVADEKTELFRGLEGAPPRAIYNAAVECREVVDRAAGANGLPYGNGDGAVLWAEGVTVGRTGQVAFRPAASRRWPEGGDLPHAVWNLAVPGVHQVANALGAMVAARCLGVTWDGIRRGIEQYEGFEGRLRTRELTGGIVLVEDIYNANPLSMRVALETLHLIEGQRRVAVLGDMLDLGAESARWHVEMGRAAALAGVALMIVCGQHAGDYRRGALEGGLNEMSFHITDDAAAAGSLAAEQLQAGDVVLVKGSRGMTMEKAVAALEVTRRSRA